MTTYLDGEKLLGIVQTYAPTGKEQGQLAIDYNHAVRDGGYERGAIFLATVLLDGLRYGNWPWTDYKKDLQDAYDDEVLK